VGERFSLSPSLSYARADRAFRDDYVAATRPTLAFNPANPGMRLPDGAVVATNSSFDRSYEAFSASIALNWAPDQDNVLFAALNQTFEAPSYDDLIAAINGTPNSSPGRPNPGAPMLPAAVFATPDLEAQTGLTAELGWRGVRGGLRFDALAYYSWLEGELLNLRDATGVSLGAVNAGETRHLGVELAISASLGDGWRGRLSYLYEDFHFRDDPVRGDDQLAGAPPHVINADLEYEVTPSWTLGLSAHWRPEETPVDNMNTLYSDAFATLDARAIYTAANWSAFVEVRNLSDETYAGSTLVVDQARPDQAAYIPGDGRAAYFGLRFNY
jgi:iron complex outermembrane receptor protein